jgi:hypothetical protein
LFMDLEIAVAGLVPLGIHKLACNANSSFALHFIELGLDLLLECLDQHSKPVPRDTVPISLELSMVPPESQVSMSGGAGQPVFLPRPNTPGASRLRAQGAATSPSTGSAGRGPAMEYK